MTKTVNDLLNELEELCKMVREIHMVMIQYVVTANMMQAVLVRNLSNVLAL